MTEYIFTVMVWAAMSKTLEWVDQISDLEGAPSCYIAQGVSLTVIPLGIS